MEKKKGKPVEVIKVTTTYWARVGDKMQFEAKAKDILGKKWTFTIDCKEPPPTKEMNRVCTESEYSRIRHELEKRVKAAYDEIVRKITKLAENNSVPDGSKVKHLNPDL